MTSTTMTVFVDLKNESRGIKEKSELNITERLNLVIALWLKNLSAECFACHLLPFSIY